ncbi:hypothetical protein AGMMS50268_33650 [Spirochaetia bacterium]|nr:hypothetical protein AGMMS50233_07700 [Endomicrobiia bacterium]GHV92862.1 hypothetical protein AGMMS50268_33650 [Spirochaetia bacterium]
MQELIRKFPPESRKHIRYRTLARARIHGTLEDESLLKDISVTGCCVEFTSMADIQPNTTYKLEVIPEVAAKIGKFELQVETRWIRSGGYSTEVGLFIAASPKGKLFQRYVDYLAWRSTTAESSPE